MKYFFDDIHNCFEFFIRNHIKLSRKNYKENIDNLSKFLSCKENAEYYNHIKDKYNCCAIEDSSERTFLENLYFLSVFDKYFTRTPNKKFSVLDIGSKNWSYAQSEFYYFKSKEQDFELNGIELDAYRLCTNLYTRYEIAKFYIKDLPNTKYIVGDFLSHTQKYDYIIWILPFITETPLIKWGLPLRYFKPKEMLLHAYDLLNKNGELLIINQGETEFNKQAELNKRLGFSAEYYGEIEDKFELFKHKRYCSKIVKL